LTDAVYLCYKDPPREFMIFRLVGNTPEAFEKYALDLAKENGVDPSSSHLIRLDAMTQSEIETLMRNLELITADNEREVLVDIGSLGLP
jgi:hypothetical protein